MRMSKIDLLVVVGFPLLSAAVTIIAQIGLLVSTLMFFGLPAAYIAIRNPHVIKKCVLFSLCLSVPLSLCIDTLAALNGAWVVPETVFPWKIFGVATWEVYIFGLLWAFYAILFYEHLDNGRADNEISPRVKYLVYLALALVSYVVVGVFFDNRLLYIPYFYLAVGIVLVVTPLGLFLLCFPHFRRKFLFVGVYFCFLLFFFEVVAVMRGQWTFPGVDFVGVLPVFGHRVPIEEILIWMVLATPALLSFYEIFTDDLLLNNRKN